MEQLQQKVISIISVALPKILFAALILVVGHFLVRLLIKIMKKAFAKFELDASLINFFIKATNIVAYIVLALSVLTTLGVSVTGVVATLSAAAVAVSLALKDSLSNIAAGILILISRPFATGDYIEVGSVGGSVVEVDMLQTVLMSPDNRKIIIPNSQISTSEVINYSSEEKRRVEVVFPISYDEDVERAKTVILRVVNTHDLIDKEYAEPFVRVSSYSDSSVLITCRVWCKNSDYWNVHFDLMENVRAEFDKEHITIPYNQLDIRISKEN